MGLLRDWLGMTPAKAFISEDEKESLQTIIQKLNQIPLPKQLRIEFLESTRHQNRIRNYAEIKVIYYYHVKS